METTVVNGRFQPYDMYIGRLVGRKFHYGNPFSDKPSADPGTIIVKDRDTAIFYFQRWLEGLSFTEHEPERRQWIIDNLRHLKGKRLGCFCKPKPCHGDVLARLADILEVSNG